MRTTAFGDVVIESAEDDLGEAFMRLDVDPEDCFGEITEVDPGKFAIEVRTNEDGDEVASSDEFFTSVDDARKYLRGWLTSITAHV